MRQDRPVSRMSGMDDRDTGFAVTEESGFRFLEGASGRRLVSSSGDASLVVEACLSGRVGGVLLYAENLPARFFDLSSGEAGAILQTLRNYRIRAAVVCVPDKVRFSSRFGEMAAEESRGDLFRVVESREAALAWLGRDRDRTEGL